MGGEPAIVHLAFDRGLVSALTAFAGGRVVRADGVQGHAVSAAVFAGRRQRGDDAVPRRGAAVLRRAVHRG